jgi:hypothetical protein
LVRPESATLEALNEVDPFLGHATHSTIIQCFSGYCNECKVTAFTTDMIYMMTFTRFVDCKYQQLAVEANREPFSSLRGAHMNALTWILQVYSILISTAFIPLIFLNYFLTLLRLKKSPLPELELMKAQSDSERNQMHKKMRKKLGFQQGTKIGVPQ